MAAMIDQHNLEVQNERVNALLENERYQIDLKDNLTFTFQSPKDLLTTNIYSLLLKPSSLLKTLEGHKDAVRCVAFSPDSKLLASASWDRTVRLWNIANGDLNGELEGHKGTVLSVAFSPDGKSIVTGSYRTIRTWSIATKQQVKILHGHSRLLPPKAVFQIKKPGFAAMFLTSFLL